MSNYLILALAGCFYLVVGHIAFYRKTLDNFQVGTKLFKAWYVFSFFGGFALWFIPGVQYYMAIVSVLVSVLHLLTPRIANQIVKRRPKSALAQLIVIVRDAMDKQARAKAQEAAKAALIADNDDLFDRQVEHAVG